MKGCGFKRSTIHDPVLENAAQNWANVLGNKKDCLVHEDPRRYGENLFFFGAKTFPTPTTTALSVTQSFYMESVGYNYNTGSRNSVAKPSLGLENRSVFRLPAESE
ncbi:hypothetical protein DICVIV_13882 [Dictyocaulus viviparus]|uniref:SCP domain-containing protein n=1 Tax=Dictyocaulus viviparus TaxID=29172 RepID=A0A0D8XCN5_DICVI|nr:hypothetical protein DICVIV_13882 [Dictyocaulus viviparus]